MTLRLRLVLALVALVAVSLVIYGAVTYSVYARSQYQRFDDQLRAAAPLFTRNLASSAGGGQGGQGGAGGGPGFDAGPGPGGQGSGGPPAPFIPVSGYAELRSPAGTVLSHVEYTGTSRPKLPSSLPRPAGGKADYSTVGSVKGSTQWRVYVSAAGRGDPADNLVVVAVPLGEVTNSLHRLLALEVAGDMIVLVLLSGGAWLILRRGLRPLEHMAGTARTIAGGDLSRRVDVESAAGEVGQLGAALNVMLDEIETAFAARDATEQRLRQFLADASHELRTPLTSIQGFAELFRVGSDPDLPTILRRIEEESARMAVLVEDLLLLARLDQTRPVDRTAVDLAVLAADACSDAVATAPDRPVSLDAPDPVVVRGDEDHLRQAVANLVTNAVRHTPAASPIEVSAGFDGGAAFVAVRDHGPGLDADALAHVFDRFWQADKARVGAGAGLGLAIVAGIAREHAGTVTAANVEGAGAGAVFTLRVPIGDP